MKKFHQKYYHAANATFLSYGDLDFTQHLEYIERNALHRFDNKQADAIRKASELPKEERFKEAKIKDELFMPDLMSEAETQAKYGITYLCN